MSEKIRSMLPNDAYRDGWDRVFGAKSKSQAKRLLAQRAIADQRPEWDPSICPECMMWGGNHKTDCTQPYRLRYKDDVES